MTSSILKNVSMNGRFAYAIMCCEFYVLTKHPDLDWKPLFSKLWQVTSTEALDEWYEMLLEITPEYLFEFPDFPSSNFEYISQSEYDTLCTLYHSAENDSNINSLLLKIRDMETRYCYSNIPGNGEESLSDIREMENILLNSSVDIPDPNTVAFSKFSEQSGWGNTFPASKIATII